MNEEQNKRRAGYPPSREGELAANYAHANYLLHLALPYMKNIVALDGMEAHMRERWIADTCKVLGVEDDKKRHPDVMALMEMRQE